MRYRALTISREYGSGGAEIAAIIARELGWRLVDKELISEISKRASISTEEAAAFDERVDPWIHRITRSIFTELDGADILGSLYSLPPQRRKSTCDENQHRNNS